MAASLPSSSLRILYLAAFGDHAGRQARHHRRSCRSAATSSTATASPLARTMDAWTIGLWPKKVIGDKLELARNLARLMPEHDEAAYFAMLKSGKSFYYLRRRAAPGVVEAVNALGEPGIALEREPDRLYPQTSLAAHVIGYTTIDGQGVAGMERAFDKQLSDPATRGQPLQLSISARIQQAMEHELLTAMTKFSAKGAAGVIMDIHTGEVLALTSLPQLNPNAAGQGTDEARFNRATLGVWELGSTFKPFTVAMAMDSGIIKSFGKMYNCPRRVPRLRQGHSRHAPYGRACSVAEIMKESSNIGSAQIAAEVGATRQRAFLDKMGFLKKSEIELHEKGRPLPPARLGSARGDDDRLRSQPRGQPAASRQRLRDLVQRRRLSPADAAQGRQGPRGRPGPPRLHRRDQLQDALAPAAGGHRRAPARRPTRRAIASAARPDRPRRYGHYSQRAGHELRGCVPDGRAALCDGDDARRTQGDFRKPSASAPPPGTSVRRSARRSAGSRRCSASGPTRTASPTCRTCSPTFTKKQSTKDSESERSRGRR